MAALTVTPLTGTFGAELSGGRLAGVDGTWLMDALQEHRVLEFGELFQPSRGVPVLVVTFLALLELARELLIEITQAECFAPIYVKLGAKQDN